MKKVILILGICLLLNSVWAAVRTAQQSDVNYAKIFTGTIVDQVTMRLKQIEELTSAEPDQNTASRMQKLLEESYALLELLPRDLDISASREGYIAPKPPVEAESEAKNPRLKDRLTPVPDRYPIEDEAYEDLLYALEDSPGRKDKLALLESAAYSYRFSTEQIIELLSGLEQSFDRLSALRMIFPNSTDPQNKEQILECFPVSTDKEKAIWIMRD
ncbi:MAG TPA: DUF4476 domain-containing protein [Candidatus Cloacimonadota bacterium]|nr:DUF4476 domain-containing protein [Candidatus Cloacimonadota bacterium]